MESVESADGPRKFGPARCRRARAAVKVLAFGEHRAGPETNADDQKQPSHPKNLHRAACSWNRFWFVRQSLTHIFIWQPQIYLARVRARIEKQPVYLRMLAQVLKRFLRLAPPLSFIRRPITFSEYPRLLERKNSALRDSKTAKSLDVCSSRLVITPRRNFAA